MPSGVAPARQAAFQILAAIERNQGNSDTWLRSPMVNALSVADRNLCTTLVLGVLRWQRVLDDQVRRYLARPGQPLPMEVVLALRLGAYQMLFLDRIPVHAAIFESVEWVKRSAAALHAGMVNAVLRKVAAQPRKNFAAEQAYPAWMVARWRKHYGTEAAQKICAAGQEEPHTAVRLLTSEAEAPLTAQSTSVEPGHFLRDARYAVWPAGELPCGLQWQDEGSQLIAELLGRGVSILDCCAAPGGKTAVFAANNPQATVLACDVHPQRLQAMQQRLAASLPQNSIQYLAADASSLHNIGPFDRILCDVPCSGTGTLARNPEIRHRLQPGDLVRQAERQRSILSAAMRLLAPAGRLLYSTCSLEPEENEQVVAACMASAPRDLYLRDLTTEWNRLRAQGNVQGKEADLLRATAFRNGSLRTLPGMHPCDGFFAAMIEREPAAP